MAAYLTAKFSLPSSSIPIGCLVAFERLGVGQRFAKPTFRPGESYNWQTDSTAFVQEPLPAWSNSCFPREFLSQHTLPVLVSPGAKRSHRLTQLPSKWRDGILDAIDEPQIEAFKIWALRCGGRKRSGKRTPVTETTVNRYLATRARPCGTPIAN